MQERERSEGTGWVKGTRREEKGGRGRNRGWGERRVMKGSAMSPSENSLKYTGSKCIKIRFRPGLRPGPH